MTLIKRRSSLFDQSFEPEPVKPIPVRIIKRYANRKLYDTQHSAYVTLYDLNKMVQSNQEIMVIDNKSKADITKNTLNQIIFDNEKQAAAFAPVKILREIIQNKNGTFSQYLAKLGAIPEDYSALEAASIANTHALSDSLHRSLGQRITAENNFNDFKPAVETEISSTPSSVIKNDFTLEDEDKNSILLPGSFTI
jgi:polyhydroxyalkanoate synthesis repressor PhaR